MKEHEKALTEGYWTVVGWYYSENRMKECPTAAPDGGNVLIEECWQAIRAIELELQHQKLSREHRYAWEMRLWGLRERMRVLKGEPPSQARPPRPPSSTPKKVLRPPPPPPPDESERAVREIYREDDAKRNNSHDKGKVKEKDSTPDESHAAVNKLYREDDAKRNYYSEDKGKGKGKEKENEMEVYDYDDRASIFSGPAPSYKTHPDIRESAEDRLNDAEDRIRMLERQLAQSRGLGRVGMLFGRARHK